MISNPEGPRTHGLKTTKYIANIVKIVIQIGPKFKSQKSVKELHEKIDKIRQEKLHT